jgi:soluble lytic murein transglycosylase-like protein
VSAQAVTSAELAAEQRVAQLQALMAAAANMSLGTGASSTQATGAPSSSTDFASALQAATTADGLATSPASTTATAASGAEGGEYEALVQQAAQRNGVDPAVLHGLIQQESGFDPNSTSSAGAAGLTQLMPGTASSLGVANPLNPAESIEGGARYLAQMMSKFGGNTADALAAYNAGPGAVSQYGGVPPYAETESYVSKVLDYAESYRQSHPTTASAGALA